MERIPIVRSLCGLTLLLLSQSLFANVEPPPDVQNPWSGLISITNNYVDQGLSNTDNKPALQPGITYTFLSKGIYLTLWGSNVDFYTFGDQHASVELDAIAGISNSVNDDFTYNIYLDQYIYPNATNANYTDLYTILSYKIWVLTLDYSYHVFGTNKSGFYTNLSVDYPIPQKFTYFKDVHAVAGIGHYFLPEETGLPSYNDYMLGITKEINYFLISFQWTDTNKQGDLRGEGGGSHFVATLTYAF